MLESSPACLKVAQRVLRVLRPYLRAGFCQALRCFPERERSERFPSRRRLLPKLLFLTLLVLWGYDGPYGGGCYAFGSVGSGCWDGCFRGWWSNNGFGRSMGTMGSDSPSHGSIGIYSSRCTSYSHGSLGIHTSRCTSYVSGPPYGYHAKRWLEYGASGSGDATNQVCCKTGRRKALGLCQLVEVSIYVGPQISGEGRMVPRARLRLLLEVHQILVGPSRSRRGANFRQHRRAVYPRKNMQL